MIQSTFTVETTSNVVTFALGNVAFISLSESLGNIRVTLNKEGNDSVVLISLIRDTKKVFNEFQTALSKYKSKSLESVPSRLAKSATEIVETLSYMKESMAENARMVDSMEWKIPMLVEKGIEEKLALVDPHLDKILRKLDNINKGFTAPIVIKGL